MGLIVNSKNRSSNEQVAQDKSPVFKGSGKRRFFQYLDSVTLLAGIVLVYYLVDTGVNWLFINEVADTQSSAQRFTFEDIEAMLLSSLMLAFGVTSAKLILEITLDSYHYFFESEKDSSWTSFKAFKELTPHQQWINITILSSSTFIAYALILMAIA